MLMDTADHKKHPSTSLLLYHSNLLHLLASCVSPNLVSLIQSMLSFDEAVDMFLEPRTCLLVRRGLLDFISKVTPEILVIIHLTGSFCWRQVYINQSQSVGTASVSVSLLQQLLKDLQEWTRRTVVIRPMSHLADGNRSAVSFV